MFDINQTTVYNIRINNKGVDCPPVKALSSILILFIGLNLAATGLAMGLCTGQHGCLHCAVHKPTYPNNMPAGHGCCETPTKKACDVEKNSIPNKSFVYLLNIKETFTKLSNLDNAAPGIIRISDNNPRTQSLPRPAMIPNHKEPLYIKHLSLIC